MSEKPKPTPALIDACLPQTQCGQCGYNGCMPYAEAIFSGQAKHNQCPPGGQRVIENLSKLLNKKPLPLNPNNGQEQPWSIAKIRESDCIGCTKCIQACPVDAIIGTGKKMHSIIAELCTGCGLCLPPCPTDCIDLLLSDRKTHELSNDEFYQEANQSRQRMRARNIRLKKLEDIKKREHALHQQKKISPEENLEVRRAFLAEALVRANLKKNN